jgi:iron complex outermembrane receptor protein
MRIASLVLCCALVSAAQPVWSAGGAPKDQSLYKLDEIVVTGSALPESLRTIPRNVTVITSEDIARSSVSTLPELLAREPGLQLFNNTGVEGRSLIDIRGQGAASATNVLVLVDGFRLNSVDMSGPNLSTLSLAQIERIEILRGPGSVLYGDNAVGGVINIITRNARGAEPSLNAAVTYGSFDSTSASANFQGSKGMLSMDLTGQYSNTDGYRDNGDLERKDIQLSLGLDPHPDLALDLALTAHEEAYGLPGGVSLADLDDRDARRETSNPDDHGSMSETRVQGRLTYDLHEFGAVDASLALRDRDNPYVIWGAEGNISENTAEWGLAWNKAVDVGGLRQRLLVGVDGFRSDYDMTSLYGDTVGVVTSTGLYSTLTLSLTEALHVNLGARTTVHEIDRDNGNDEDWHKTVLDAGASYDLSSWGRVYASAASGFRAPTIDEMNWAADDIKPQTSVNYEVGINLTPREDVEMNVAVYHLRTEDEIYYDNLNWLNDNYDDVTVRNGVEADVRWWVLDNLTLRGGYAWTRARFEDTGKTVPLVAEHEFSLGADWRPVEPVLLSVDARHATSRFDGSDVDNDTYEKIDGYTVVDLKGTWDVSENFTLTLAVNNVFDELYSTTGYNESYYVMPGRNFLAGIQASF